MNNNDTNPPAPPQSEDGGGMDTPPPPDPAAVKTPTPPTPPPDPQPTESDQSVAPDPVSETPELPPVPVPEAPPLPPDTPTPTLDHDSEITSPIAESNIAKEDKSEGQPQPPVEGSASSEPMTEVETVGDDKPMINNGDDKSEKAEETTSSLNQDLTKDDSPTIESPEKSELPPEFELPGGQPIPGEQQEQLEEKAEKLIESVDKTQPKSKKLKKALTSKTAKAVLGVVALLVVGGGLIAGTNLVQIPGIGEIGSQAAKDPDKDNGKVTIKGKTKYTTVCSRGECKVKSSKVKDDEYKGYKQAVNNSSTPDKKITTENIAAATGVELVDGELSAEDAKKVEEDAIRLIAEQKAIVSGNYAILDGIGEAECRAGAGYWCGAGYTYDGFCGDKSVMDANGQGCDSIALANYGEISRGAMFVAGDCAASGGTGLTCTCNQKKYCFPNQSEDANSEEYCNRPDEAGNEFGLCGEAYRNDPAQWQDLSETTLPGSQIERLEALWAAYDCGKDSLTGVVTCKIPFPIGKYFCNAKDNPDYSYSDVAKNGCQDGSGLPAGVTYNETTGQLEGLDANWCGTIQIDHPTRGGISVTKECRANAKPKTTTTRIDEPPTSQSLVCSELSFTPVVPKIGDTVSMTCSATGNKTVDHFEFQYSIDGGAYIDVPQSSSKGLSESITLSNPGDYFFRCQACEDAAGTACTGYETTTVQ